MILNKIIAMGKMDLETIEGKEKFLEYCNNFVNNNMIYPLEEECKVKDEFMGILANILDKSIPKSYTSYMEKDILEMPIMKEYLLYNFRDAFVTTQGYSLLAHDWIDELIKWIGDRKVLEVMAGCGSLSYILKEKGVDIKTTDNKKWINRFPMIWCDIEEIDSVEAIEKYGVDRDIIIMSWPPFCDIVAYESLLKMREVNPNAVLIFIGESNGCCGDVTFFENAKEVNSVELHKINQLYRSFPHVRDHVIAFK